MNQHFAQLPLSEPTTVHSSCFATLLPNKTCLVVTRGNNIDIFHYPTSSGSSQHLDLLISYSLTQEPISINKTRLPNSSVDVLVLLFDMCKISLVGIGFNYELITVSLHTFEHLYTIQDVPHRPSSWQTPIMRIDPANRCIVVLLHDDSVGVVPLTSDDYFEVPISHSSHLGTRYALPSFHHSLASLTPSIRDFSLLPGLSQPCAVFLYERTPVWTGGIESVNDSLFSVTAVSFDLPSRLVSDVSSTFTPIWSQHNLPSSCTSMSPLRSGGVLLSFLDGFILCTDVSTKKLDYEVDRDDEICEDIRSTVLSPIPLSFSPHFHALGVSKSGKVLLFDIDNKVYTLSSSDGFGHCHVAYPTGLSLDPGGVCFVSSRYGDCPLFLLPLDINLTDLHNDPSILVFDRLSSITSRGGCVADFCPVKIPGEPYFAVSAAGLDSFGCISVLSTVIPLTKIRQFPLNEYDASFSIMLPSQDISELISDNLIVVSSSSRSETVVLSVDNVESNLSVSNFPVFNTLEYTLLAQNDDRLGHVIQVTNHEIRLIFNRKEYQVVPLSVAVSSACFTSPLLFTSTLHDVSVFSIASRDVDLITTFHDSSPSPIVQISTVSSRLHGQNHVLIAVLRRNGSGCLLLFNGEIFIQIFVFSDNLLARELLFFSQNIVSEAPFVSLGLSNGSISSTFLTLITSFGEIFVFKILKLLDSENIVLVKFPKLTNSHKNLDEVFDSSQVPVIRPVVNILGKFSGLFIPQPGNSYPYLFLTTSLDNFDPITSPRLFPIKIFGKDSGNFVPSFLPLPHVSLETVFFLSSSFPSLASFPTHSMLSQHIFSRSLQLNATVNRVCVLEGVSCVAVAVESGQNHEVRLIDLLSLSLVDRYPFKDEEAVLSMCAGKLRLGPATGDVDEGINPPPRASRETLCIGTGYLQGESIWVRGRVVLLNPVVDEQSRITLSTVWDRDERGHVTAIGIIEPGYLVTMSGARLHLQYLLQNGRLKAIGFYDCRHHVTDLKTIKNLIVLSDLNDSTQIIAWKNSSRAVDFVSRDATPCLIQTACTEFFIPCGENLRANNVYPGLDPKFREIFAFSSDFSGNVSIFSYDTSPEFLGGLCLKPIADYHTSSPINRAHRVALKQSIFNENDGMIFSYPIMTSHQDGSFSIFSHITSSRIFELLSNLIELLDEYFNFNCGITVSGARLFLPLNFPLRRNLNFSILDVSSIKYLIEIFDSVKIEILEKLSERLGTAINLDHIYQYLREILKVAVAFDFFEFNE
ncbi:hypothetical protein RCL1_006990 [Eukaryota sp. TZLM3-RCL]